VIEQKPWVSNVSASSTKCILDFYKIPRVFQQLLTVIPELYSVISENAPDAIKTGEIKNHFGRKVAIVRSLLQRQANGFNSGSY